jgi:hypothetical protein
MFRIWAVTALLLSANLAVAGKKKGAAPKAGAGAVTYESAEASLGGELTKVVGSPVKVTIDASCRTQGDSGEGKWTAESLVKRCFDPANSTFLTRKVDAPDPFAWNFLRGPPFGDPSLSELVQNKLAAEVLRKSFHALHLKCANEPPPADTLENGVLTGFVNPLYGSCGHSGTVPFLFANLEPEPLQLQLAREYVQKNAFPEAQKWIQTFCGASVTLSADWDSFKKVSEINSGAINGFDDMRVHAYNAMLGDIFKEAGKPSTHATNGLNLIVETFRRACSSEAPYGADPKNVDANKKAVQTLKKLHFVVSLDRDAGAPSFAKAAGDTVTLVAPYHRTFGDADLAHALQKCFGVAQPADENPSSFDCAAGH